MQFRLKSGKLRHEGRTYVPGDIITTDLPLNEMFRNTIEVIEAETVKNRNQPKLSSLPASLSGKEGDPPSPSFSFVDITKDFANAGDRKIFRKGKSSFIVFQNDKEVYKTNKKGLVLDFLAK